MKFVCLGYFDEEKWNTMSESERDAWLRECFVYDDDLLKSGHLLDMGQALKSVATAKTLRWNGGEVLVTDGPFAETKEQLGGFGIFEARDMEQGVELMAKHPAFRFGGPFELRPIEEALTERCDSVASTSTAAAKPTRVVCIGCGDESVWNALSKDQQDALTEECIGYDKVLRKYGRWVGGVALQSAATAKTLRSQGGEVLVTDGPYAETREQIGGVATYDFLDMSQAIEAWSQHPSLRMGNVLELRQTDEEIMGQWEARHQRTRARPPRNGR